MFRSRVKLKDVMIAAPCPVSWENMEGDEKIRACSMCQLDVYNLSEMTKREAEELLSKANGERMCLQLYRRADGTILTKDCPIGAKILDAAKRRTRIVVAAISACLNMLPSFAQQTKQESVANPGVGAYAGGGAFLAKPVLTSGQQPPQKLGAGAIAGLGVGGGVGHASDLFRKPPKAPPAMHIKDGSPGVAPPLSPLAADTKDSSAISAPVSADQSRTQMVPTSHTLPTDQVAASPIPSQAEIQMPTPVMDELQTRKDRIGTMADKPITVKDGNHHVTVIKPPRAPGPAFGAVLFGGLAGTVPRSTRSWVKKTEPKPVQFRTRAQVLAGEGLSNIDDMADMRPMTYFLYGVDYEQQRKPDEALQAYAYALAVIREDREKYDPKLTQVIANRYTLLLRMRQKPSTAKAIEKEFLAQKD